MTKQIELDLLDIAGKYGPAWKFTLVSMLEQAGFTIANVGGLLEPEFIPVGNWTATYDIQSGKTKFCQTVPQQQLQK